MLFFHLKTFVLFQLLVFITSNIAFLIVCIFSSQTSYYMCWLFLFYSLNFLMMCLYSLFLYISVLHSGWFHYLYLPVHFFFLQRCPVCYLIHWSLNLIMTFFILRSSTWFFFQSSFITMSYSFTMAFVFPSISVIILNTLLTLQFLSDCSIISRFWSARFFCCVCWFSLLKVYFLV